MAAPPTRQHSVKHGPPIKNETEVENYMQQTNRKLLSDPPDQLDIDQKINADLLQIISKGINVIVDELKMRLGSNFTVSNANAAAIKDLLDSLKTGIDADIAVINLEPENKITLEKDSTNSYYITSNNENFYREDLNREDVNNDIGIGYDTINIQDEHNFTNLDSNYNNVVRNQENLVNLNFSTIEQVNNRLKNCQNLEFLYLKKHDEIMRIFAFTINLFDKYKYAIKVILFLLKNLVYKDRADGTSSSPSPIPEQILINMPLPIITNIKKLVTDQKNIQGVIDRMKDSIMPEAYVKKPIITPANNPYQEPDKIGKTKLTTLIPTDLRQKFLNERLTNQNNNTSVA